MESGSNKAIVLKVWVYFCCHIFGEPDVVVLRQEIISLSLFNSLTENIVLTSAFVLYSNRNVNLLGERIKILEWILRSFGTDEFFKLPDVILIGSHHRINIVFLILEFIFEVVLFNWIIVFVKLSLEVLLVMTILLLPSKFTFNLGDLSLRLKFVSIFTFLISTGIILGRITTLTSLSVELTSIRRGKSFVIRSEHFLKCFGDIFF